ncbi:nuclear transport factor 2 family protein [Roseateles chitinivorans]|uniref:nuclear transport factor 2 family protein n=1 Tax=Roseateles chitinivorans TaxID=2917965 RepID=UPI003D669A1E
MDASQLDTVRAYLRHLHASDTAGLISSFEEDGLVHSPFLGTMLARDFFPKLAQASSKSVITLIDLFASVQATDQDVRIAAYFRYDWTLSDGRPVDFTCVDVFAFRPGSRRIQSMHIVYDTHPLREQVGDKYAPVPASAASPA